MKAVFAIIKKEFARFFLDRRMLLTTLILPGLLIYVVYTLIGSLMSGAVSAPSSYSIAVRDLPQSLEFIAVSEQLEIENAEGDESFYLERVADGGLNLYVVFPEDFDEQLAHFGEEEYAAPNIEIYYNSSSDGSSEAYTFFSALLDSAYNIFNVNASPDKEYDLAGENSVAIQLLSAVVPMVMLVMLFSGCMAVAPESIAGEKERGTFATMLVTPVKRSHIAVGKIISLSCIALLSGISSFIGLILSLPNLIGGVLDGVSLSMFGFGHYAMTLCVMLSTVLMLVALISVISALAKSVKEANSYVGPINIIVLVAGLVTTFAGSSVSPFMYLIPVYNSALLVTDIMSLAVSPLCFAITVISNIVYACALVFLLTRMFKSERIMFNK